MKREYWRYLRVVFPYLRRYRHLAAASVAMMLVGAALALLEPWPLALLVDGVLGDKGVPGFVTDLVGDGTSALILFAVLTGLGVKVLSYGLTVANEYVNTRLDQRIGLDFRSDLYEHCQTLSQAWHDNRKVGDFMYRINMEAHNAGRVAVALPPFVESFLRLIGMFVIALRIDQQLALLSLVVVPFIYYSTGYYGKKIEPELMRVRNLEGQALSMVNETMALLRVIVAFNREAHEARKFRQQGNEAVAARVRVTVSQTMFSLGVGFITAVGTALVLGVGAHHVVDGSLSVGQLLVVMAYIASIYAPLETISRTLASFQEMFIGLKKAQELFDEKPIVFDRPGAEPLGPVRGAVAFDGVAFAYPGRDETLKDITFSVEAGETIAVVGTTGAGKTTLMNLLLRYTDPAEGAVRVDGVDLRDVTLASLRRQISIVHQEPLLFSATIAENIRYGRLEATDEEVEAAARSANAHDFISRLPRGYDTVLGERGANVSGGERQRICVARAFLKDAPILILDEPTSSIDSRTEKVILDALDRLTEGRTTFMIAHRLSTVRSASRILVLERGRVIEYGSHDELLAQGGHYRHLWELQIGPVEPVASVPPAADSPPPRPTRRRRVLVAAAAPEAIGTELTNGNGRHDPIDLNGADESALATLPGVDPVLAAAIVEYRRAVGDFDKPEDLLEVSGMTSAALEQLQGRIVLRAQSDGASTREKTTSVSSSMVPSS